MEHKKQIFALIIGTEILNRRREDKHFAFLADTLQEYGHTLSGSFIIEDNPELIVNTIKFIASFPNAVLFSFGGIGSTPDDHTRKCAAIALRNGKMETHPEAKKMIEQTLGDEAYPYPIKMANLPIQTKLLANPINQMPGFYLDDRYFFMPGFPQMSHPMVEYILENIIPKGERKYRYTLTASCKENYFIPFMHELPKEIEVSSLPKLASKNVWKTTLSLESSDIELLKVYFQQITQQLQRDNISFVLEKNS